MLAHEKLQVYNKALGFVGRASALASTWSRKHAVADQFDRAAESLILNLADACRFRPLKGKLKVLDYALGSGLECAGCLDVALIKGLMSRSEMETAKLNLSEVVRMLVGLRKTWETWNIHEAPVDYASDESMTPIPEPFFHHENLEVYRVSLELMTWIVSLAPSGLPEGIWRKIDDTATSVILNIAEGNGRYSELDHHRFLDIAAGSAVKVAAYLDLMAQRGLLKNEAGGVGKAYSERIAAMLSRM